MAKKTSRINQLLKMFRTGNVVRHHFQSSQTHEASGIAKAIFGHMVKGQGYLPQYANGYDRFSRYVLYSEMDLYSITSKALDTWASESTQKNEDGRILEIVSEDKKIQELLQELFYNVLHMNGTFLWKKIRNVCKYGAAPDLIDVTDENGVIGLISLPINEIEVEKNFDPDDPQAIRFKWINNNNLIIPNAFMAFFKLEGNENSEPYGHSMLDAARRPYLQTVLLEDSAMIYRISRAAERRIFFLDVGGSSPDAVKAQVNEFHQEIKKAKVADQFGRVDLRYNHAMAADEDYVIPIRGQETATRIETLPGAQNLGAIEDIEMIKKNLFAALGIPKAFLTFDEGVASKQTLTMEDIRFAREIARIQDSIINELVKIAMIHLFVKGYEGSDLVNFRIKLTNPSTVAELQKIELWRARLDLVLSAGENVFDQDYIYKKFLNLSNDEIEGIRKGKIKDAIFKSKLAGIENSSGMGSLGMAGGLGGAMGGLGGFGGGLGAPGGGLPVDAGMGAPPPGGGMPPMGEAIQIKGNDTMTRDMHRRHKRARGVDGMGIEGNLFDPDPSAIGDIDSTISMDELFGDLGSRFQDDKKQKKMSAIPESITISELERWFVPGKIEQVGGLSTKKILSEGKKAPPGCEEAASVNDPFSAWEQKILDLANKSENND